MTIYELTTQGRNSYYCISFVPLSLCSFHNRKSKIANRTYEFLRVLSVLCGEISFYELVRLNTLKALFAGQILKTTKGADDIQLHLLTSAG